MSNNESFSFALRVNIRLEFLRSFEFECVKCYCLILSIELIEGNFKLFKHMFQIFKKLGVKFNDLFLRTERLRRNLNYFTVNLPLDFSEIFNTFRITVFFLFSEFKKIFEKNLELS